MAYVVGRKRKGKSGVLTYYYLVEGYRKNGKVKQRIVKYLGTSPFQTEFDLDPKDSVRIARVLSEKNQSSDTLKQQLEKLGISFPPGELKEARLIFKPPPPEACCPYQLRLILFVWNLKKRSVRNAGLGLLFGILGREPLSPAVGIAGSLW